MAWLGALWAQAFRDERVIEPGRFLHANLILGLFAVIVLIAGQAHPERTNLAFTTLVAVTVATHVGGAIIARLSERAAERTLFAQGISLFATSIGFVAMCTWLTWQATALSNVRYLPGIALSLFLQASLELEFFGVAAMRTWRVRRIGIVSGVLSELAMAAALVRHLVQ